MITHKRNAILLGFFGLILLVLGAKTLPSSLFTKDQSSNPFNQSVILFFSIDEPCECMLEITEQAERQMTDWQINHPSGIPVYRISMDTRKDLEAQYKIFRAPCLVVVDEKNRIVWRQDYPLIEGGPFALEELEAAIAKLGKK
jgi:hypothetical protein